MPGPGSHDFDASTKFKSLSVHKFSKSKTNPQLQSASPNISPSTYHINSSLLEKKLPSFSIDRREKKGLKLEKLSKTPGPTDYEPKVVKKSQLVSKMPQSVRPNMIKHLMENPGPGEYSRDEEPKLKGRVFKFSKSPRTNVNDEKIKKTKSTLIGSYEKRELFPNPPTYMGVKPKIKINEGKIVNY